MKIVFFTNKCTHGFKIIKELSDNNIKVEAILIEKLPKLTLYKNFIIRLNRIGKAIILGDISESTNQLIDLIKSTFRKIFRIKKTSDTPWFQNDDYYSFFDKVFEVKNFNNKKTEEMLNQIKPDIIILGGSRILRDNIISIPKIGIINAHPGLLPKYRGIDVIPWAILKGDKVGVTTHFIDKGVDTGDILLQEEIIIEPGDTIKMLSDKAEDIAAELTLKTILALKQGQLEPQKQKKSDGQQYYRMPLKLLKKVNKKLKSFKK